MFYSSDDPKFQQRLQDWDEIEDAVMLYKKQFQENPSSEDLSVGKNAAARILDKFSPLLKKYTTLLKSGQIDWNDKEMKLFISNFIDDTSLQRALQRKKQKAEYRSQIYASFNFVKETYGELPEEEILLDLQTLILTMAQRYKQVGRNFCSYIYNCFRFEVARHINKFIRNPLNISYKNLAYEDCINGESDYNIEQSYEDNYYEDLTGIPNSSWILGENCSEAFANLTPLDRKILVKYYLEEWKDKQIADHFGMHINTVNQRRRSAAKKIAQNININNDNIKRTRRSGKKAILPTDC